MFVCAHPAIDAGLRTALMLQTVLGIDAARIAQACLVPAETMAKRLVRVKAKIKANGLRFEEPDPQLLEPRVAAVLDAIYGAYTLHWGDGDAAARCEPGPYQIEAAIQSAHNHRASGGVTPWADIVVLYERLLALAPTVGARIGHAMALARAAGTPRHALALLDAIDATAVGAHQPWWAARAQLLRQAGQADEAAAACRRALALTREPALRRYFERQLER
jgi:predicted RNA polymerase sigma factor